MLYRDHHEVITKEEALKETQDEYDRFWKPIIEKDGVIDLEQLKKELYDYSVVMECVAGVYCDLTGGHISKLMTSPDVVIAKAREVIEREVTEDIIDTLKQNAGIE